MMGAGNDPPARCSRAERLKCWGSTRSATLGNGTFADSVSPWT